MLDVKELEI